MSDHEAVVRRAIDAVNRGDWAGLADCIHPDMRLSQPVPDVGQTAYESFTGTYLGRAETVAGLERIAVEVGGIEIDLRGTEPAGEDRLLYEFVWLIGPKGERSAQLGWGLSSFKDGLVLSSAIFGSEAAAREAIARGA